MKKLLKENCGMLRKVNGIIKEKRLPWFISSRLEKILNSFYYFRKRCLVQHGKKKSKTIVFNCGYHGKTGGVFAIANIANLLSKEFNVEFVSYPTSNYNRLLVNSIKITPNPDLKADIFLCDVSCDHVFFQTIKGTQKKIIVSCHGLPTSLHGLDNQYVDSSLSYADLVHFVSQYQQESFNIQDKKYVIIPNISTKIRKESNTNNVGVVGNLNEERKNVKEAIDIALESDAGKIHIWGADNHQYNNSRIIVHPWENDKTKIYNSFDVFVLMSKEETFGLVVAEAMSAGIPCLLSDIPPFESFALCPGIKIISNNNRKKAPQILNDLLSDRKILKNAIISYWQDNYSDTAIIEQWRRVIIEETRGLTNG